jgi:hypothetical protein
MSDVSAITDGAAAKGKDGQGFGFRVSGFGF